MARSKILTFTMEFFNTFRCPVTSPPGLLVRCVGVSHARDTVSIERHCIASVSLTHETHSSEVRCPLCRWVAHTWHSLSRAAVCCVGKSRAHNLVRGTRKIMTVVSASEWNGSRLWESIFKNSVFGVHCNLFRATLETNKSDWYYYQ